ncbi:MAG: PRD domain-containing protein [Oenococcus sp.]|uniref:BglG family transcription antiterminator LicT n=1 Tax=Oenococcus sp. TaxID=1979414 RepID=UPI0039E84440
MKIKKIFNNNILLADSNGQEVVLIGKGLGFQKKSGQVVDEQLIDRVYTPTEKRWFSLFNELIDDIPSQYFETASQVIKLAEQQLQTKFNAYLLIGITDHLHFAIQRARQNLHIRNEILWEIQHLYSKEYQVGQEALSLVKRDFKIRLPDDEAGFIALKFVENRTSEYESSRGQQMTKLIADILTIVRYQLQIDLNEDSMSYQRFLVHLRFFVERITDNQRPIEHEETDQVLYKHVFSKYPLAFRCTQRIAAFVQESLGKAVSVNEQVYVTIHIQRIIDEVNQ